MCIDEYMGVDHEQQTISYRRRVVDVESLFTNLWRIKFFLKKTWKKNESHNSADFLATLFKY